MSVEETLERAGEIFENVTGEIGEAVVGQRRVTEEVLIAMLCDGHVLIEGNPGLAKTLLVRTVARVTGLEFSRIQCTPDLMPSEVTGTYIIEESDGRKEFRFRKGQIFANVVLADEINRASPKTQSALLESMQERQVTVGNDTYPLERPFLLLATQNPIEMEGTFPLPEAQLDRFLLKSLVDYPSLDEEREIVDRYTRSEEPEVGQVLDASTLLELQALTREVPISEENRDLAIDLVRMTRETGTLDYGASPRASISLVLASKARALLRGRNYVSREDLKEVATPVLRHRVLLSFQAEREDRSPDDVVRELVSEL